TQGGKISHDLIERGGKVTQDITERGSQVTQQLAKRGSKLTQDITERGNQVTQQLAKRGSKLSHDLSRRGDQLVKPLRKRNSTLWIIFGFSIGMVASAVVTYLLVRKRVVERAAEAEQQIELPQDLTWSNGNQERQGKPMGEILHLGVEGNTMATTAAIQVVDVDVDAATPDEVPPDAVFVGYREHKTLLSPGGNPRRGCDGTYLFCLRGRGKNSGLQRLRVVTGESREDVTRHLPCFLFIVYTALVFVLRGSLRSQCHA
ncbi:MAG TPA: hypothetical protein DCL75_19190, partial [Ktedonobacter sp.]|nr:hypothetical protein [Ktedonobacter sp.]